MSTREQIDRGEERRRRREEEKSQRARGNENKFFLPFQYFFSHHLSIKSKELIHTSFLLYYIYIRILERERIYGKVDTMEGDHFSKVEVG